MDQGMGQVMELDMDILIIQRPIQTFQILVMGTMDILQDMPLMLEEENTLQQIRIFQVQPMDMPQVKPQMIEQIY